MFKTRRDFFFLWAQAVIAAQRTEPATFFTAAEREALKRAAAVIIPPDERSLGGSAPGVVEYIEAVVAQGDPALQGAWRRGLAKLPDRDLEPYLQRLAKDEFRARTPDERFFVLLKGALVEGFYTSEEGIQKELGYQGMGHVMEFPDFTGVKAEVPAGYRPQLRAHS
jgi:hypothetical protein